MTSTQLAGFLNQEASQMNKCLDSAALLITIETPTTSTNNRVGNNVGVMTQTCGINMRNGVTPPTDPRDSFRRRYSYNSALGFQ